MGPRIPEHGEFYPAQNPPIRRGEVTWSAENDRGARCLHRHRSFDAAAKCAAACNQPTPLAGTPQGAYEHAAGYHD